jgi:protein-disulfide isomerase
MKQIVTVIVLVLMIFAAIFHKEYNIHFPWSKNSTTEVTKKAQLSNPEQSITPTKQPESFDMKIFAPQLNDIVLGDINSKVSVVEYSSPTCPHCSYYHKDIYPQLKAKYIDTGKISYVLREFITNKQDLDAALLGRCLKDPKDPLKLFQVIYSQQDKWATNKNYRQILENLGQLAGISREEYDACLNNKELIEFLANHSRTITFYKDFPGTPSFFINAKIHKSPYTFEALSANIEAAIKDTEQLQQPDSSTASTQINIKNTKMVQPDDSNQSIKNKQEHLKAKN